MKRHQFDPVSFFFGAVFLSIATWLVLINGDADFNDRWFWPAILIVAGLGIALSGLRHGHRGDE
jgi:hypothetical protein